MSPFVLAAFAPAHHMTSGAPTAPKGAEHAPTNTIVVILDEFSAARSEDVAAALRTQTRHLRTHEVTAVGTDTINVIPQMFGGKYMPTARVCAFTAVCDDSEIFDFRSVTFDPASQLHLVGFFHPYCAASGWISCVNLKHSGPPPILGLLCSFGRFLPTNKNLCDLFNAEKWDAFRQEIIVASLDSPFWKSGGHVFIHLPMPHPPGLVRGRTLMSDYDENLALSRDVVQSLWSKAVASFGSDFQIIITSDHPLRPKLWCRSAKYKTASCAVPAEYARNKVPFIQASPKPLVEMAPKNNADVVRMGFGWSAGDEP
jgi:hypothetical protein